MRQSNQAKTCYRLLWLKPRQINGLPPGEVQFLHPGDAIDFQVALDLKYVKHINYVTAQTGRQTVNESKDNPIYFTLYAAPTAAETPVWVHCAKTDTDTKIERYKVLLRLPTSKESDECNKLTTEAGVALLSNPYVFVFNVIYCL